MWIINKNSRNTIKIGLTEIGSYLEVDKPITMDWSDCQGSMGRYCTMLGMKDDNFINLMNDLNAHLYNDYSENEQQLFTDFKPLFTLLENGLYFLNYSKNLVRNILNEDLVFPKSATTEKTFIKENEGEILHFTSQWYFEDINTYFIIATQLESSINKERVEFYKNEIIQGKRPFIITIYKSYIEDKLTPNKTKEYVEWDSSEFLLDGHHKFLAYKELGIFPPIFTICQGFSNSQEIYFDFEKLKNSLNIYQIEHLKRNIE